MARSLGRITGTVFIRFGLRLFFDDARKTRESTLTSCSEQAIEISLLREAHLPFALEVQAREQWNQTARDWQRLLRLSPDGCFAAFYAGRLAGTVTVLPYGTSLAWIGMTLVAQEHRGRGIGRRLMDAALNYCERSQIATVKLDATPAGRHLYESLGFVPEDRIERWRGTGFSRTQPLERSFYSDELCRSVFEFDDQAFYAPRRELLDSLLEDCCVAPAMRIDGFTQRMQGYGLARRGARASYAGPIVAADRSVAIGLLDSLLERLAGDVVLDIGAGRSGIVEAIVDRGFAKQRDLTRMSLGRETARASHLVFAIAGPELG
jgi:GNAT superfamily N-acetyltransferase